MKVVVPHTFLYEPTVKALGRWPGVVEWVDVSFSPDGYLIEMGRLFREGAPFILCEHDVVPKLADLDGLAKCRHLWCACLYREEQRRIGPPLGLCRFRSEFLHRNRDLFSTFDPNLRQAQESWTYLNQWFNEHADGTPHLHGPPYVRHDAQRERARAGMG